MAEDAMDIIIYSDDKTVRESVIQAVGLRPGKGLPKLKWTEAATATAFQIMVKEGQFPVAIVDAEATKISGLIAAKTLSYEIQEAEGQMMPVFVALTARPQDDWLAEFSGVAYTVMRPLNPIELQEVVARAVRQAQTQGKV